MKLVKITMGAIITKIKIDVLYSQNIHVVKVVKSLKKMKTVNGVLKIMFGVVSRKKKKDIKIKRNRIVKNSIINIKCNILILKSKIYNSYSFIL